MSAEGEINAGMIRYQAELELDALRSLAHKSLREGLSRKHISAFVGDMKGLKDVKISQMRHYWAEESEIVKLNVLYNAVRDEIEEGLASRQYVWDREALREMEAFAQ